MAGFDPLKAAGSKPAAGTPDALKMGGAGASAVKSDLSKLLDMGKSLKYSALPSVVGKTDGTGATARKVDEEIPFQSILLAAQAKSSKTISSVDVRNAWMFNELRAAGKLRTLVIGFDDVTRESLVTFHGERRCVEKGLVGRGGQLDPDDIEREGLAWLEENNVSVWEPAKRIMSKDQEEILYPGFDAQMVETGTLVIRETAKIVDQYMRMQRPHILVVDRHSTLHEDIGTAHALAASNKRAGDKLADREWDARTAPMKALRAAFLALPTMMLISTGQAGDVKYRISVDGEEVRDRVYDDRPWQKFVAQDYLVTAVSESQEPVDSQGAPMRTGARRTFKVWVRSSQTRLVPPNVEIDTTGSGLSKLYELRRPKKNDEKK